jgi:hypothetical protein
LKAAMAECPLSTILRDNYLRANGGEAFRYLMGLRNNNAHYLQFVDTILRHASLGNSPGTTTQTWKGYVVQYTNRILIPCSPFSDEAFILLLIDNYAERWNAEMALKKDLVRYPAFVQTQTFLDKNHLPVVICNRESTV